MTKELSSRLWRTRRQRRLERNSPRGELHQGVVEVVEVETALGWELDNGYFMLNSSILEYTVMFRRI